MSEKLSLEEKIDKMQNEIDNLKKECEYWAKEVEDITELLEDLQSADNQPEEIKDLSKKIVINLTEQGKKKEGEVQA